MNDLIKYISELFGLQLTSKFALLDMENDIGTITDHAEYVKYLKQYFNLSDIQYLTAYQKFLELTKRYKKIEQEAAMKDKIATMGTLAYRLSQKVMEFDTAILNHEHKEKLQWEHFIKDGEFYFSAKEIKALSVIGSPLQCILMQRSCSGSDKLLERLETLFVEKVMCVQLPHQQSISLISGISKEKRA